MQIALDDILQSVYQWFHEGQDGTATIVSGAWCQKPDNKCEQATMNIWKSFQSMEQPPRAFTGEDMPNFRHFILLLRRQCWLVITFGLAGLLLGFGFLQVAQPKYLADVQILIERQARPPNAMAPPTLGPIDAAQLQSQIEIIRSKEVAGQVLEVLGGAKAIHGIPADIEPMEHLRRHLNVLRVDNSYVFVISYLDRDAEQAARIANAYAISYIERKKAAIAAEAEQRQAELDAKIKSLHAAIVARQNDLVNTLRNPSGSNEAEIRRSEIEVLLRNDQQAYEEALLQQRQAGSDHNPELLQARILDEAVPPTESTGADLLLILTLGTFLGLAAGGGFALLRENSDDTLRTAQEVCLDFGFPCLGYFPSVPLRRVTYRTARTAESDHLSDLITRFDERWRHAYDWPTGHFAETLRFIRARAERCDVQGRGTVIAVTSVHKGEGKTTLCANLALLLAAEGAKVLLVDADLRASALTLRLHPGDEAEQLKNLMGGYTQPNENNIPKVNQACLVFLSLAARSKVMEETSHHEYYLNSSIVERLINDNGSSFDFILLDLPALYTTAYVQRILPLVDCWIMVTRWGSTRKPALRAAMQDQVELQRTLLGLALNDVNMSRLRNYTSFTGDDA